METITIQSDGEYIWDVCILADGLAGARELDRLRQQARVHGEPWWNTLPPGCAVLREWITSRMDRLSEIFDGGTAKRLSSLPEAEAEAVRAGVPEPYAVVGRTARLA